jgi:ABC-type spermidine/putrescine transport system permease subunit I
VVNTKGLQAVGSGRCVFYTEAAVIIALVHVMLLFMVISGGLSAGKS